MLFRLPAAALYHYTTRAGLLGIIAHTEIGATRAVGEDQNILSDMLEGLKGIESMNGCGCSFSVDRDPLSRWRAYGSSTWGYAIGFDPVHLAEMVRREEFYLVPCPYSVHVFETGLARFTSDHTLWDYARTNVFTIVTADTDFPALAKEHGAPPKVIRLENCNHRTAQVEAPLRRNAVRIGEWEQSSGSILIIRDTDSLGSQT